METLGHGVKRRLRIPGLGFVDGMGGAALSAAVALGLAWLAGAVALQTPGAIAFRDEIQRSTILKTLNDTLPPSGPVLNALGRFDPFPQIDGPSAGVPAPRAAIARDPQVQGGERRRREDPGHGVRARRRGVGLDRGRRHRRHERARGRGPGGHDRPAAAAPATATTRPRSRSTRPTTSRSCASRASAAVRSRSRRGCGRAARRRSSGSRRTGRTTCGRARRRDALGPDAGRLRPRPGPAEPHDRCAASCGTATRAARWSTRAGRVVTTVFAATQGGGPSGGFGVPNAIVRRILADASGSVDTGPCAR